MLNIKHLNLKVILAFLLLLIPTMLFSENKGSGEYLEMFKGNPNSDVTIVEYASFTCPHCASFHHEVIPLLEQEYIVSGKVKFVYREVYFDAPGLWAGLLARCAGPEKYFGIVDLLYKKQSKWASGNSEKEILRELFLLGRQVGIEKERLNLCLQDKKKSLTLIDAYLKNSKLDGVTSTPSLVVNGKLIKYTNFDNLRTILDETIAKLTKE